MHKLSAHRATIYWVLVVLIFFIPSISGCGGNGIQGLENAGSTVDGSSVSKSLNSADKDQSSKQCLYSKVTYTLDNGKIITYQFDPDTLSAVTPSKSGTQETRSSGVTRQAYDGTVMGLGNPKAAYVTDKLVATTNAYTFFPGAGIAEEYIVCPEPNVYPESNVTRQGVTVVPSPESGLGPITYTPTAPSFTGAVHIVANYIIPDIPPKPWHESWEYVYLVGNPVPVLTQYYSENGNVMGLQFTMGMGSDTENIVLPRTLGDWHFISNNNMSHSDDIINMRELIIKDPVTFVADDNISNKIKVQAEIEELSAGAWTANIARAKDVIVDPNTQETSTIDLIWDPATKYLAGDWIYNSGVITAALSKGFSLTVREIANLYMHTITAYEDTVKTFAMKSAGQEIAKLTIENAKATPEKFNPTFKPPGNESIITASIVAKGGLIAETISWNMVINKGASVVKTFTCRIGAPGAGPWNVSETWDGNNDSGAFAGAGDYNFKITATATANGKSFQCSASGPVSIVDRKIEITDASVEPSTVAPGDEITVKCKVTRYPSDPTLWNSDPTAGSYLADSNFNIISGYFALDIVPPVITAAITPRADVNTFDYVKKITIPSSYSDGNYNVDINAADDGCTDGPKFVAFNIASAGGLKKLRIKEFKAIAIKGSIEYPIDPVLNCPKFYPSGDEELKFEGSIVSSPPGWSPNSNYVSWDIIIYDRAGNEIVRKNGKGMQITDKKWSGYSKNTEGQLELVLPDKYSITVIASYTDPSIPSTSVQGDKLENYKIISEGYKVELSQYYQTIYPAYGNPINYVDYVQSGTKYPLCYYGCHVTTVAMIFSFYNIFDESNIIYNPQTLNKWLSEHQGYYPGGIVKEWSVRKASNFTLLLIDCDKQTLRNEINMGHPAAIKINSTSSSSGKHWLAVHGLCRSVNNYNFETLMINDPIGNYILLDSYCQIGDTSQKVSFHKTPPQRDIAKESINYCSITIAGNSFSNPAVPLNYSSEPFIELCVTDSSNRKTGYDYASKSVIETIPDCFYNEDCLSSSDPNYPPGPIVKLITIQNHCDEIYNLQVIGIRTGGYEINLNIVDQNQNDRDIWNNIRRITSPGTIHNYEISFNRADVKKFTITKVVSHQEIKDSLTLASNLNWIDNKGILNSLTKKIENADAAYKKGQINSSINLLQAFINEVEAQKGKHIASAAADILIDDANSLIKQLQK